MEGPHLANLLAFLVNNICHIRKNKELQMHLFSPGLLRSEGWNFGYCEACAVQTTIPLGNRADCQGKRYQSDKGRLLPKPK